MLVVIAGLGNVGRFLLEQFSDHDASIIVIENDAQKIEKIKKQYDVLVKPGNMLSHYVLRGANVSACDFFIACSNHDSNNIVACQLAKRMGAGKTLARIYSEDIFPYDFNQLEDYLGIDWLVSPSRLSGYNLAFYLHQDQNILLDNYFSNQMDIARLTVSKNSSLNQKKVSKLIKIKDISVIALLRDGKIIDVNNTDFLKPQDEIVLLGKNQKIINLLSDFYCDIYKKNEKIYVAGTSAACLFGISLLESSKNAITLFEKDQNICNEVQSKCDIKVINLDPSDFHQIKDYQADTEGVFICAGNNDAENLTYALNAEELGFKTIIPIVNEYEKMRLFKRFNFSHLIPPPYLSSKEIFRLFSQAMMEDFELLEGIPVQAIIKEIKEEDTWTENEIIDLLDINADPRIVAIYREGEVMLPSLNQIPQFKIGDKVLITSNSGNHKKLLVFATSK